jgi:ABC-type branched-subunit amino acid transport system substrate-binding protein
MRSRNRRRTGWFVVVLVVGVVTAFLTPTVGGATPRAVTATGGTIKIGGLGFQQNFGDATVGAEARFKRANDTKEVKGYTFEYAGFANDNNDQATALAEARRLVTQERIFALVPDVSLMTPGTFLDEQQIPWFGTGYDATYCPDTGVKGWGFSVYGCILRQNPKRAYLNNFELLLKELESKGQSNLTMAQIGTDSQSAKTGIELSASSAQGAGFKVVYAKATIPAPPAVVGDYSPYVQAVMTSNGGQPPDVFYASAPPSISLTLFNDLRAAGFKGTILSPYYSKILVKPLAGSYVFFQFAGFEQQSKGIDQLKADVEAFKPGAALSLTVAGGYFAADMFIQAVKQALKSSKTLTTTAVQKAASKMTYQIKDTIGPTKYPDSYEIPNKACSTLEYDADGTGFTIAQPFSCTTKTYPILPKFSQ